MQEHKYFTREGNIYIKKNQNVLHSLITLFLFALTAVILINNPNPGANAIAVLFGLLAVLLGLRMTGKFRIDTDRRIVSSQSMFFVNPTEYRFEDFQHFHISRQIFLITLNATASMILLKNGKQKTLLVHQTIFVTKPLQRVTEEISGIMGIPE